MALTFSLIFTSGTLISWIANEPWLESLWSAALGSGLDWGFVHSTNYALRFIALCTNVGGLVLTALLLSIISDAVQTKYDSLRKGESVVTVSFSFITISLQRSSLENLCLSAASLHNSIITLSLWLEQEVHHTLIIGWSVKVLSVITQLAKSRSNLKKRSNVIVCLTNHREKEDMERDISEHDFNFAEAGVHIVCRSGCPLNYHELRKVSFSRAKSIIILGDDENDAESGDARSLQVLLSIVVALERERVSAEMGLLRERLNSNGSGLDENQYLNFTASRPERIVIEVMDTENAAIMKSVCPDLVEPVLAHDVVGRLLLQAARNPLVADVWQELVRLKPVPGKTFVITWFVSISLLLTLFNALLTCGNAKLGFDGCEIYSAQWGITRGLTFGEVLLW